MSAIDILRRKFRKPRDALRSLGFYPSEIAQFEKEARLAMDSINLADALMRPGARKIVTDVLLALDAKPRRARDDRNLVDLDLSEQRANRAGDGRYNFSPFNRYDGDKSMSRMRSRVSRDDDPMDMREMRELVESLSPHEMRLMRECMEDMGEDDMPEWLEHPDMESSGEDRGYRHASRDRRRPRMSRDALARHRGFRSARDEELAVTEAMATGGERAGDRRPHQAHDARLAMDAQSRQLELQAAHVRSMERRIPGFGNVKVDTYGTTRTY